MLQIKVNGDPARLFARLHPDGGCAASTRSSESFAFASETSGTLVGGSAKMAPTSEMDLVEMAVAEAKRELGCVYGHVRKASLSSRQSCTHIFRQSLCA
jgi:hypothetical protein